MNILIVTNLYPLPWEPNRATFNKHQFKLLGQKNKILLLILVPWLTVIRKYKQIKNESNGSFDVVYVPYFFTPKVLRATYGIWVFLALLRRLRIIKEFKPDYLFSSWAYPDGVGSSLLAKLLNIPVIIKVHGSDINEYLESGLRKIQILWSMRQAKAIVAVSQALRDKLVNNGVSPSKVHVIYNGIDKSVFFPRNYTHTCEELRLDPARKRILFVGNLKKDKGCLTLLEAFQRLCFKDDLVDLYYIGKGDCESILYLEAKNAGLNGRVFLLGVMDQYKIGYWMNAVKVVALPSKNEGVPNVLLEAMACGVPVVAYSVGGIPEVVGKGCGSLCEFGNLDLFVNCLENTLNHPAERTAISTSVSEMEWGANVAKIEKIVEQF